MSDPRSASASSERWYVYGFDGAWVEVHLHEPPSPARVPERLLHDIWATQRFDRAELSLVDGRRLQVAHPGLPNPHGGPDFRDARIEIEGAWLDGDIELHIASGDWQSHRHERDPAYNGTVLHVTLFPDVFTGRLRREDGVVLPECVLAPRLQAPLRSLLYDFHRLQQDSLPCASMLGQVDPQRVGRWIETLGVRRVASRKTELANAYLAEPDLESMLHRAVFHALGAEPNGHALEELARRLPLSIVRRLVDPLDLEALHLGTAGFLPVPRTALLRSDRPASDAIVELETRYEALNARLGIVPMSASAWQFFRLRPANFPTLRIAQAAALIQSGGFLHQDPVGDAIRALRSGASPDAFFALFDTPPSRFWNEHYRFGKRSRSHHDAGIGRPRRERILLNAVAPLLALVAEQHQDMALEEAVFAALRRCKPERDHITARFDALERIPQHAVATQGLHALFRSYCQEARCLSCEIGRQLTEAPSVPPGPGILPDSGR
ncbi:MAG: DUF2851 family protein [Rhodothermales bacterium]